MIPVALSLLSPALAADGASLPLARAGEVPHDRLYTRVDQVDGRVRGRWRRKRDAEFHLEELEDGTVLRLQRVVGKDTLEDDRFDAGGWPLVSLYYRPGGVPERAVIHGQPEQTVSLEGWTLHDLPGGRIAAPQPPVDLPGGSVRLEALDGELDVWTGPDADPLTDGFRDGLVAGCGCTVVDRAAAWVDGRPGVRYRLLVPDAGLPQAVDLWAVPLPPGLWLATFRASSTEDPTGALLAGRVLLALVDLDPAAP